MLDRTFGGWALSLFSLFFPWFPVSMILVLFVFLKRGAIAGSIPVSCCFVVIVVDVFVSTAPFQVGRCLCLCFDLGLP